MKLSSMIVLATVLAPSVGAASEYHIYKDTGGSIVLSNLPVAQRPADRAPGALALVNSYNWVDATAEEIAATEKENREAERTSALRELAAQTERLADEMERSNDIGIAVLRHQLLRPTEINQVIVNQGFRRFGFIGRR